MAADWRAFALVEIRERGGERDACLKLRDVLDVDSLGIGQCMRGEENLGRCTCRWSSSTVSKLG